MTKNVEYIRRSRFVKGLEYPELAPTLQAGLQSGEIVVLDDEEYLRRFPVHERLDADHA